jgi:hypothetical protein
MPKILKDIDVVGNLKATTKSFLINHPSKNKNGWQLQYGSLESPYHGIRLTGNSYVSRTHRIVCLPDYIDDLIYNENINIQITNIGHDKIIYIDDIDLKSKLFRVKTKLRFYDTNSYKFFWSFTGIRKDVARIIVEIDPLEGS